MQRDKATAEERRLRDLAQLEASELRAEISRVQHEVGQVQQAVGDSDLSDVFGVISTGFCSCGGAGGSPWVPAFSTAPCIHCTSDRSTP